MVSSDGRSNICLNRSYKLDPANIFTLFVQDDLY